MKTEKYYRLNSNNNYGGQKGGKIEKSSWAITKKLKGIRHSIAAPFKKSWRGKSGNTLKNGNTLKTPQNLIDKSKGFFTTKSTRLRQAQEAAMGLSLKDQKRAEKITSNSTTPLSLNKEKKRQLQAHAIAKKLQLNTKNLNLTSNQSTRDSYKKLQSDIKDKLEEKKKIYAEETFQQLQKTKDIQANVNVSKQALNTKTQLARDKSKSYTNQKEIINLLETLKQFPGNLSVQTKLMKLNPATYGIKTQNGMHTFKENSFSNIDTHIAEAKANIKQKKENLAKAFKEQNIATKSFRIQNKKLDKQKRHYGSVDALKSYSNKKTIAHRASRVAQGVGMVAGIAALGAASIIAPPVGIALTGLATGLAGSKIKSQMRKKSTLLKTLNSNSVTASNKETARNLIVQKTNSPKAQYKLDKALARGTDLINKLGDTKTSLLAGTYENFKNRLGKSTTNYSTEDYAILKDYYKAHKIKEIREGKKFATTTNLGTTKPSSFSSLFSRGQQAVISNFKPFTQTTEQRLKSYTDETPKRLQRLPKNNTGKLEKITNNNYIKFLPLLTIKPDSLETTPAYKTLFTNSNNLAKKQYYLKRSVKTRHNNLKFKKQLSSNEKLELEKLKKIINVFNIDKNLLSLPLPQLPSQ